MAGPISPLREPSPLLLAFETVNVFTVKKLFYYVSPGIFNLLNNGNPVDAGLMTKILERVYPDGRGVSFSYVLLKLNENTSYSDNYKLRTLVKSA